MDMRTSFISARSVGPHFLHSASVVPGAPGPRMTVMMSDTVAAASSVSWEKPCIDMVCSGPRQCQWMPPKHRLVIGAVAGA